MSRTMTATRIAVRIKRNRPKQPVNQTPFGSATQPEPAYRFSALIAP